MWIKENTSYLSIFPKFLKIFITNITLKEASTMQKDDIHPAICQLLGPVIIDFIHQYRFNSAHPEFVIQLSNDHDQKRLLVKWRGGVVGNTKILN